MAPPHAAEQESRAELAAELARRIRRRWRADVVAIGATGALAHDDDDRHGTGVELMVATYRPGGGPAPTRRRLGGHVVTLVVGAQPELLGRARRLTPEWPLRADGHLHVRPLDDDSAWLTTLRDAHRARLAEATLREFSALAQEAWCEAWSLFDAAARSGQWHDDDGAILLLARARLAAAVTDGLLTRTYFRGPVDAARRAGTVGLDLVQLRARLTQQAAELEKRGCPVDAEPF